MAGPSDAFFRDIVKTVGGKLAQGLPELEKRQAAARALGKETSLADVAVALGLMEAAKVAELAALEGGKPAAPAAPAAPPRGGSLESSSKRRVPTCTKCKAPLAVPDIATGTGLCTRCRPAPAAPAPKKRLRDRAKMVSSVALEAISNLRPAKRRRAREAAAAAGTEPPKDNTQAIAIVGGGLALALVLVTIAVVFATNKGGSATEVVPPPPTTPTPPPPPAPVVKKPDPPAPDPTLAVDATKTDDDRRMRLGMIEAAAIKRAQAGDFAGADERLGALRAAARPEDSEIVDRATKTVKLMKAAADIKKQSEDR